jgi:hypothetical protein
MNKDKLFGWGIIIASLVLFLLFYMVMGIHITI